MSEHKHVFIYKDNYSILDTIKLKCTICGAEGLLCKECKQITTKPWYSCWDDDKSCPYCEKCMDKLRIDCD